MRSNRDMRANMGSATSLWRGKPRQMPPRRKRGKYPDWGFSVTGTTKSRIFSSDRLRKWARRDWKSSRSNSGGRVSCGRRGTGPYSQMLGLHHAQRAFGKTRGRRIIPVGWRDAGVSSPICNWTATAIEVNIRMHDLAYSFLSVDGREFN